MTQSMFDSPQIQQRRQQLAAAFRWAAELGLHESTCNHFSVLAPGLPDHYLINPFGVHFAEMRASDLLLLDGEGRVVAGQGEVEASAFHIHSSIHRANAQAVCVLHTHMPYACAILGTERGRLELCHQNAARFHGRIAYDDEFGGFNGLALNDAEGARMAGVLDDKSVLMLQCHGPLVIGSSVALAFDNLYYLERAAQVQVLAQSCGRPLALISEQQAARTCADFLAQADLYAEAHFAAIQRLLDKQDPTWRH
ncbi:aldolase [Pseudomonas aeruginosa]|uniref:aldolase n=1 Tax=Pseudomonas aeruginosa TaxID=287 RepID=UPI00053EC30B|nr:aldolase [Pseudomonas aeruginosa]WCV81008.1 aldolase [Pseudomonas aeruginosa]HBO0859727.1 aldolase [Pseudomonas aeruginosa]HCE6879279.1 aldolase [Pseudomonas aeruginosa]HDR2971457.1 aldolase [Pseudomonas aeruginosa]